MSASASRPVLPRFLTGLGPPALLALLLAAAGLALRGADPGELRTLHPDLPGATWFLVLGGSMTAAGLPRQILAFAGAFVFGPGPGFLLAMGAQLLGCLADYTTARFIAGSWAQRRLARARWRPLEFLKSRPFAATITLRLLPVGNNVVLNLLAGAARLSAPAFLAGTAIGYVPQTIIFVLLGSGVQVGEGARIAVGGALLILSSALGLWLYRRSGMEALKDQAASG